MSTWRERDQVFNVKDFVSDMEMDMPTAEELSSVKPIYDRLSYPEQVELLAQAASKCRPQATSQFVTIIQLLLDKPIESIFKTDGLNLDDVKGIGGMKGSGSFFESLKIAKKVAETLLSKDFKDSPTGKLVTKHQEIMARVEEIRRTQGAASSSKAPRSAAQTA